ncbi:DUF732 domain-containing protein [Actinomadura madurae]|uniref:DUF732 domain-containing protein n=1 Tax=Actinomadura madurae TaxID=1993 RepID=UPI00202639AC|nr:hypothetical protein [Actinomadura madurae]MCP9948036.1 hypothetical protein [Actinomadura madurae]MCP9964805.1 hypothetical protein [Actinomadura madurae]MCP9977287.1 hypothetical protein [Actinomadura madurae]MCQ0011203.1 hypothetical protein [Actinomadura madurae]MCQ0013476.1 hypothetical protein [Actinomadura madurae]
MRQIMLVAAAALTAAVLVLGGAVAFFKLNPDDSRDAGRVAETGTSAPANTPTQEQERTAPRPTVTITEHRTVRPQPPAEPPVTGDADENFLAMIAADGITAPDDWAIEAGNATCGQDYESAREYLTDGGLYDHHVQTFLDDWMITHGGC